MLREDIEAITNWWAKEWGCQLWTIRIFGQSTIFWHILR